MAFKDNLPPQFQRTGLDAPPEMDLPFGGRIGREDDIVQIIYADGDGEECLASWDIGYIGTRKELWRRMEAAVETAKEHGALVAAFNHNYVDMPTQGGGPSLLDPEEGTKVVAFLEENLGERLETSLRSSGPFGFEVEFELTGMSGPSTVLVIRYSSADGLANGHVTQYEIEPGAEFRLYRKDLLEAAEEYFD